MDARHRRGPVPPEHAGCRTPEKAGAHQGKLQASPFTDFADQLSPITPRPGSVQEAACLPPLASPAYGATGLPGAEAFAPEFAGQSVDKSSLRSSYETEPAAMEPFLGSPAPARHGRSGPHWGAASCPVASAPLSQPHTRHPASAGALRGSRADHLASGGPSSSGGPGHFLMPSDGQQGGRLPPSPFAAMASEEPPEEWAGGAPASSQPSEGRRQRKRVLRFPSPVRGQEEELGMGDALPGPRDPQQPGSQPAAAPDSASPPLQTGAVPSAPAAQQLVPALPASAPMLALGQLPHSGVGGALPLHSMPFPGASGEMTTAMAAAMALQCPMPPAAAAPKRSGNRRAEREAAAAAGQKRCNCKKSRCLKLYCDCFAAGLFCTACTCTDCKNTPDHRAVVLEMRETIQARNSNAFDTKVIQKVETSDGVIAQHKRGCHCKKSNCKKKYCECFQAGVNCGQHCKCENCHNQSEHGPPDVQRSGNAKKGGRSNVSDEPPVPRRASARPRKRSAAAASLDAATADPPLLLDGWAAGGGGGGGGGGGPPPAARQRITSPPSLVWESQPLYQATGTLLDERGLPGLGMLREGPPPPHLGPHGRGPARAASALPDLSAAAQARGRPLRSASGSFLGAGLPAEVLRGHEAYLPLPAYAVSHAESEGLPPEVLAAAAAQHAGLLRESSAALGGPHASLGFGAPGAGGEQQPYGGGRQEARGADDFGAQGGFYGQPEAFLPQPHEGGDAPAAMAVTRWTDQRIDDLEAGDMGAMGLGELLAESNDFLQHLTGLQPELERGSPGQDENAAPYGADGLPALAGTPGQQGKLGGGRGALSPARNPFGQPPSGNASGGEGAPSALRTHRPAGPALAASPQKRAPAAAGALPATLAEAFPDGLLGLGLLHGMELHPGYALPELEGAPGHGRQQAHRQALLSPPRARAVLLGGGGSGAAGAGAGMMRLGAGSTIFSPPKGE